MAKPWQLIAKYIKEHSDAKAFKLSQNKKNTQNTQNTQIAPNKNFTDTTEPPEILSATMAPLVLPSVNGYFLKYRYGSVQVSGIKQLKDRSAFLKSAVGDYANLVIESNSQDDKKVIIVTSSDGQTLGYLPKDEQITDLIYARFEEGARVLCLMAKLSYTDYKLALLVGFYVKKPKSVDA